MSNINQALVRAHTLLMKKVPSGPDEHEERFRFFTQTAAKAPFLALDCSQTDTQTWSDRRMSVKDALEALLPSAVMSDISPKLGAIQSVMDGSAKVKGLTSFFYSQESGNKHVAQFCIFRIPKWDISYFEVHFVEVKAYFDSWAIFGIASTTNRMDARYCYQKYSTNTAFLMQEMKTNPEKVRDEMDEWDQAVKAISK